MDRKVSKYFQLSPPLSEDTVVQRELFKVKEVRDRRRWEKTCFLVFLSRVCSKLYLPPTSRNSIVVQLRIDR